MAKNNTIGKTKRSTDDMIDDAINQQNEWLENRRNFTRRFLKRVNLFAKSNEQKSPVKQAEQKTSAPQKHSREVLIAYWFPILCALIVIAVALWVIFWRSATYHRIEQSVPAVPEPIIKPVRVSEIPEFDLVRISHRGEILIAGRSAANDNVSVLMNKKIIATVQANSNGEFVYAPRHVFKAGNYTISLVGASENKKSADKVFVYVSERGGDNSMSLLMTPNGSRILQAPSTIADGDLNVSKIDYLDNGRIVVTGTALPRMRISLSLNDKYLGFARVSDHRNFGLGANVGELKSGEKYVLTIRMHDGDGHTLSQIGHRFTMPSATGDKDTFYTVRSGDCLWIIARNFTGNGMRFTMIATANNIKNPNLIYPKQKLRIPTKGASDERTAHKQTKVSK